MENSVEGAISRYSDAYHKVYHRRPSQLHTVGKDWIIVNGARMQPSDLDFLTSQLLHEYQQTFQRRRTIVGRLIKWFKQ
jgi:hypothetical protein